jgi:hypothetical protein
LNKKRIIALTTCVAFLIAAAVAWAHDTVVYVPSDGYRSSGTVYHDHSRFYACDGDVDGNRVRVRLMIGNQIWFSEWAPSQGCGPEERAMNYIQGYRVCVENEGCTPPFSQPGKQP